MASLLVSATPPRTQKARGLQQVGHYSAPVSSQVLEGLVVQDNKKLNDQPATVRNRWARLRTDHDALFLRPCPVVPCPGFVESRKVTEPRWNQVRAMMETAQQQDPNAEVLVMPYLNATLSAVLTPGRLTIGAGHDGATRGVNTVDIPLVPMPLVDEMRAKEMGIAKGEEPHLELVQVGPHLPYLVQIRSGPAMPNGSANYIPERYDATISTLYCQWIMVDDQTTDFLQYEAEIKRLKAEEDPKHPIVVGHQGGSLASHFGLHALAYDVGYITEDLKAYPALNQYKNNTTVGHIPAPQRDLFQAGLAVGLTETLSVKDGREVVGAAIHAVHHASAMLSRHAYLVGLGIGHLFRYGALACAGEARHLIHYHDTDQWGLPGVVVKDHERNAVYSAMLNQIEDLRDAVGKTIRVFMDRVLNTSRGIGGRPWAQCAWSLVGVEAGIGQCLSDATAPRIFSLVGAANTMINQAHNNGWWLNKFTDEAVFQQAQKGYYHIANCLQVWYMAEKKGVPYRHAVKGYAKAVWATPVPTVTERPMDPMVCKGAAVLMGEDGSLFEQTWWDQGGTVQCHQHSIGGSQSGNQWWPHLSLLIDGRRSRVPMTGTLAKTGDDEGKTNHKYKWSTWVFSSPDSTTTIKRKFTLYGPRQGQWVTTYDQVVPAEEGLFRQLLVDQLRGEDHHKYKMLQPEHLEHDAGWDYVAHLWHHKPGLPPPLPGEEPVRAQATTDLGTVGVKEESTHVTT